MRILLLGGDGMLGHQLLRYLAPRHEIRVTLRQDIETYGAYNLFNKNNAFEKIDLQSLDRLNEIAIDFHPEVIINCIGVIKQRKTAKEKIPSIEINALLPHRLAVLSRSLQARLIHMSTDCVFNGKKGGYVDDDFSDAEDLYGKTKFLGEVEDSNCLTLRTSIIGRELSRKKSLLEWFLAQEGTVNGYTRAIYSGFSTLEMSRIIETMIISHPHASGVYQVSSDPISKYDLLVLIKNELGLKTEIIPDSTFHCDRSLDSSRFRSKFSYNPPSWAKMVKEMVSDFKGTDCYR